MLVHSSVSNLHPYSFFILCIFLRTNVRKSLNGRSRQHARHSNSSPGVRYGRLPAVYAGAVCRRLSENAAHSRVIEGTLQLTIPSLSSNDCANLPSSTPLSWGRLTSKPNVDWEMLEGRLEMLLETLLARGKMRQTALSTRRLMLLRAL